MQPMNRRGQASLTSILLTVGVIVTGVWVWKRLSPDTQDYVVEHIIPIAFIAIATMAMVGIVIRKVRRHRARRRKLAQLMDRFERAPSTEQLRELAFSLIEINRYRKKGLERVASALVEVLLAVMNAAVGDKQHRVRGMAASYVGVLENKRALPQLLAALDDDHAYVRACAALGLGRMRATEAKVKLAKVSEEDWDQTVRSRAREALERLAW